MKCRAARKHGASRRAAILAVVALFVFASAGLGQKKKKGDDEGNARTVTGQVTSADDMPVSGAVVQLKNTKTLQIRSFITKEDGTYYFNGLSPDVDYELRADSQGLSSSTKTLSSFDSRKAATINLKLNKK
jgi:Carboxypeptidase regulatory-like domain